MDELACPGCGSDRLVVRQYVRDERPVTAITDRVIETGEGSIDRESALEPELVCADCATEVDPGGRDIC